MCKRKMVDYNNKDRGLALSLASWDRVRRMFPQLLQL